MRLRRIIPILAGAAILGALPPVEAKDGSKDPAPVARTDAIKKINAEVAKIDQQKNTALPFIEISTDYREPSEGAPAVMKLFFAFADEGGVKLRACQISTGHETYSDIETYYFDAEERLIKYRSASDRDREPDEAPEEPVAIIYGTKGEMIWKNYEGTPKPSGQQILSLFKKINEVVP